MIVISQLLLCKKIDNMRAILLAVLSSILSSNYLVISQGVLPEEVIEQEIPRDGKKFKTMFQTPRQLDACV